jgi:hypothetical protein
MQHLRKTRGGVAIMVDPVLTTSETPSCRALRLRAAVTASSSVFRILFQVPYPVSPLLATLTKTPGVWGYSSHSGTPSSAAQPAFPINYQLSTSTSCLSPFPRLTDHGTQPLPPNFSPSTFNFQLSTSSFLFPRITEHRPSRDVHTYDGRPPCAYF